MATTSIEKQAIRGPDRANACPAKTIHTDLSKGQCHSQQEPLASDGSQLFAVGKPEYPLLVIDEDDNGEARQLGFIGLTDLQQHLNTSNLGFRSRFISIRASPSSGPFNCSKEMFLCLLSFHEVMPQFLDTVRLFSRTAPGSSSARFPYTALHQERLLSLPGIGGSKVYKLGRFGRQIRHCFNFWRFERSTSPGDGEFDTSGGQCWALRQNATYHSFDVESGKSLWINIAVDDSVLQAMKDAATPRKGKGCQTVSASTSNQQNDSVCSSFADALRIHTAAVQWCKEEWRAFINDTEMAIHLTLTAGRDGSGPGLTPAAQYTSGLDASEIMSKLEDNKARVRRACSVLTMNINNLDEVAGYYSSLWEDRHFPRPIVDGCEVQIGKFNLALRQCKKTLEVEQYRLETLIDTIQDRMVSVSSSISHSVATRAQASAERTENLVAEMQGSRKDAGGMANDLRKVVEMAKREAASMHTITVITLIFLPMTSIATLFSSGIFNWDADMPGGLPLWNKATFNLFIEICIPLTAMVVMFWAVSFLFVKNQKQRGMADEEQGMSLQLGEMHTRSYESFRTGRTGSTTNYIE